VVLLDDQFDRLLEVQAIQHLALYLVKPVGPSKLSSHVSYILRANPGS
jgi:hypothetical protein